MAKNLEVKLSLYRMGERKRKKTKPVNIYYYCVDKILSMGFIYVTKWNSMSESAHAHSIRNIIHQCQSQRAKSCHMYGFPLPSTIWYFFTKHNRFCLAHHIFSSTFEKSQAQSQKLRKRERKKPHKQTHFHRKHKQTMPIPAPGCVSQLYQQLIY